MAFCQKEYNDSIRNSIDKAASDTERVRLLVQLGNRVRTSDTAESWRCQQEIARIAEKTGKDYFQGQAYFLSATISLSSQPAKAIGDFEKAIKIFSKYSDNRRAALSLGSAYINLGLLHTSGNDYETAILYYLKAEELYLRYDKRNPDLAVLYSNISITYGTLNKYDEGIRYSKKGLDWAKQGNDKVSLMNAMYAYGGNLVTAKKGDSGLPYLDTVKLLAKEMNNWAYMYNSGFMKAMYYYNTKQYQKAIDNYDTCLVLARENGFLAGVGYNYLNISANEAELNRPQQAKAHLDSSAKYLDYSVVSEAKQMYFENYAEIYKQLGKYSLAFDYKDSVGVIKDSLYQADNVKQMEFRQARYSYEKKQKDIEELENERRIQQLSLKQKSTLNAVLFGGLAALILLLLLLYSNYRQKQKMQQQRINELETEKKLAATEAVLKGEEQERTRLAKDLHDGLGGMLSGIKYSLNTMKGNLIMTPENAQAFERSMDMLDSSIREMRRVAHNMMPEALVKFGLDTALKDFCNDINQSGALKVNYQSIGLEDAVIEQTTAITIYRIVQELLNNTMKHAAATNAIVQISKTDGLLSVTVEDDGKGFDTAILDKTKGIGWSNIQNRVEFLKGKLDVNSQAGKGTSVLIELNV
ncbi:MAG: tetratricopeptide repeat protein [Chitinophagaceae bacterium]|nr:tetratricopeptide repeat protein [Chitinophagaceae bacterium]